MKFNVYFLLKGPASTIEGPNKSNPVECASLAELLEMMAPNLPHSKQLGIETVGIRIEPVEE